jgi:hypothetical protein
MSEVRLSHGNAPGLAKTSALAEKATPRPASGIRERPGAFSEAFDKTMGKGFAGLTFFFMIALVVLIILFAILSVVSRSH